MGTTKSLAGTSATYVELQIQAASGILHIQGAGGKINRDYGVSDDMKIPNDVYKWIAQQKLTLPSLTGSSNRYAPAQARLEKKGVGENAKAHIHLQVHRTSGSGIFNRTYGLSLVFPAKHTPSLHAFLEAESGKK